MFQTASDINENIRRAENELKLFAISKRFPNDDVNIVSAKKTFIRHKGGQIKGLTNRTGSIFRCSFSQISKSLSGKGYPTESMSLRRTACQCDRSLSPNTTGAVMQRVCV